MDQLESVLVVDDSRVMRETLKTLLSLHSKSVQTAASCDEARAALRRRDDVALVICDVRLPDGSGFDLLEERAPRENEFWLLTTGEPEIGDANRALALGALGYMQKPISHREIIRNLQARYRHVPPSPRRYRRLLTRPVWLVDGNWRDARLLEWELHNVSLTGAFIATPGPIPAGTTLVLDIDHPEATVRVRARVVRVQEPSWSGPGGVGVQFTGVDAEQRRALEALVGSLDVERL